MSERETASEINDRAAALVARLDASGGDPAVQAEIDGWLAGDMRRRGAFFRAQSAWMMLDRASVLGAGHGEDEAIDRGAWLSRRRMMWGGAAAASAVVAGLAFGWGPGLFPAPTEHIQTAIGEIRRVPLPDGSMAAVNTGTKLAVQIGPEIRSIALDEGEAWFQVAHDRKRPFVVEAGDVRVRAVGTAFSVRRTDGGADVQVTEGTGEVWRVGAERDVRRVSAGAKTFVSYATGPAPAVEASVEIDRSLSWRSGQLIFDGDTLGAAAAEFNRYNAVQVRIADPALANEKFVGRFRTNEPDAFARATATILSARAEIRDGEIVLSRK
ncbi:MAG TPA: FecR domain-containing protein [Sphingopyxis sp.]|nr:FecR domain-containing protein [Sphingopyxis sp.]